MKKQSEGTRKETCKFCQKTLAMKHLHQRRGATPEGDLGGVFWVCRLCDYKNSGPSLPEERENLSGLMTPKEDCELALDLIRHVAISTYDIKDRLGAAKMILDVHERGVLEREVEELKETVSALSDSLETLKTRANSG